MDGATTDQDRVAAALPERSALVERLSLRQFGLACVSLSRSSE
jgi:hypothetical protein